LLLTEWLKKNEGRCTDREALARIRFPIAVLFQINRMQQFTECLLFIRISYPLWFNDAWEQFYDAWSVCCYGRLLTMDNKSSVQKVNIKKLQSILKTNPADGSTPEIYWIMTIYRDNNKRELEKGS